MGWYLTDHLGSVRDVVSDAGVVLDHIDYDAFGNVANETNPAQAPLFGFQGMRSDRPTATNIVWGRVYAPWLPGWMEGDPSGVSAGDANLRRFVGNDPTNATDPTGLAVGHHWVPVSVLEKFRDFLSDEAFDIALGAWTGQTSPDHGGGTYGGVTHPAYTDLVAEQMDAYIKRLGLSPEKKMTAEQMRDFALNMRDGKLQTGEAPGFWSAKYKKIADFNEAVQAERTAFEAASKTAKPLDQSMEKMLERGKWYRGNSGRIAGLILATALAEVASSAVNIANAATNPPDGQRPYFRDAVQALSQGNLNAANEDMVGGPTENDLGGFVGQINAAGDAKAALWFLSWWQENYQKAVERGKALAQSVKDGRSHPRGWFRLIADGCPNPGR